MTLNMATLFQPADNGMVEIAVRTFEKFSIVKDSKREHAIHPISNLQVKQVPAEEILDFDNTYTKCKASKATPCIPMPHHQVFLDIRVKNGLLGPMGFPLGPQCNEFRSTLPFDDTIAELLRESPNSYKGVLVLIGEAKLPYSSKPWEQNKNLLSAMDRCVWDYDIRRPWAKVMYLLYDKEWNRPTSDFVAGKHGFLVGPKHLKDLERFLKKGELGQSRNDAFSQAVHERCDRKNNPVEADSSDDEGNISTDDSSSTEDDYDMLEYHDVKDINSYGRFYDSEDDQ